MKKEFDLWNEHIRQAKGLLNNRKACQLAIAKLATEVCDISWGGSPCYRERTLVDFAKEIGMSAKTLSNWVAIKRRIYDKLSPELQKKANYSDMLTASKTISSDAKNKNVEKAVSDIVYSAGPDQKLLRYISTMRTVVGHMNNDVAVALCKKDTLEQILYLSEEITKGIKRNVPEGIVGVDHGFMQQRTASVADAFGSSRLWKMTESDQKVLNYLKTKTDFVSVKEIYTNTILPSVSNSNTAKLRSLRALNKLSNMGHVITDTKGRYKIKSVRIL